MVWGMHLPSSFGEFWPDGYFEGETKADTEGWFERLKQYYSDQPADVQKRLFDFDDGAGNAAHSYPSQVVTKFKKEIGTKPSIDRPPLTAIQRHEPPTNYQTCKTYAALGSLIMLSSKIIAVDGSMKAIIERLEPDVHQFFPIEIRMPRGAVFPENYFILVIGRYLDSFSPDSSKPGSWKSGGDFYYRQGDRKSDMAGLAFSTAVFGEADLWRERRLPNGGLTLFSDLLKGDIDEAGLRLPKIFKMRET